MMRGGCYFFKVSSLRIFKQQLLNMSDRKESLQRTLKMQNDQLEQWERLRSISRDPDEQLRCDGKIADIKALIGQNETELKKLKKTKTIKEADPIVPVASGNTDHFHHNHIVFDISENSSVQVINNKETGLAYNPLVESKKRGGEGEKKSNKQDIIVVSVFFVTALALLFFSLDVATTKTPVKITSFFLSQIVIALIYIYPPISSHLSQGLKFGISILVQAVYAAILFWEKGIFGDSSAGEGKKVWELIIIPLIISVVASIISLMSNQNSHKPKKE
jgi:hypothetical protein